MATEEEKVVERILTETMLSLTEARDAIADATGKRPDKATVARWIHRGVRGNKLEAVRLGSKLFTSTEALNRFIVAGTKQHQC